MIYSKSNKVKHTRINMTQRLKYFWLDKISSINMKKYSKYLKILPIKWLLNNFLSHYHIYLFEIDIW